jgi:hypothetical protein
MKISLTGITYFYFEVRLSALVSCETSYMCLPRWSDSGGTVQRQRDVRAEGTHVGRRSANPQAVAPTPGSVVGEGFAHPPPARIPG